MTKKPRLISDEPTLLNLIDGFVPEVGLRKVAIPFLKDLSRNIRNRENIISSLGFVIRINAFERIFETVIGA